MEHLKEWLNDFPAYKRLRHPRAFGGLVRSGRGIASRARFSSEVPSPGEPVMLLNQIEKALMNNTLRAWVQRRLEAPRLLDLGGPAPGAVALEVGCGRGVGVEIILDRFRAARVDAFDLDAKMIELARRRLAPCGDRVRLWVGDVSRIEAEDASYDAVFDFGIIHHVPDWRGALSEVHRVLRPGGRFYAEEVLERFIVNPLVRRLLDHPLEDRFDAERFSRALTARGFRVIETRSIGSLFGWFVADKPADRPPGQSKEKDNGP